MRHKQVGHRPAVGLVYLTRGGVSGDWSYALQKKPLQHKAKAHKCFI